MDKHHRSIEMTYKKVKLQEKDTDFAFWQTQPYSARLGALEEIRQLYISWKYDTQPRFQRVLTITKRK